MVVVEVAEVGLLAEGEEEMEVGDGPWRDRVARWRGKVSCRTAFARAESDARPAASEHATESRVGHRRGSDDDDDDDAADATATIRLTFMATAEVLPRALKRVSYLHNELRDMSKMANVEMWVMRSDGVHQVQPVDGPTWTLPCREYAGLDATNGETI